MPLPAPQLPLHSPADELATAFAIFKGGVNAFNRPLRETGGGLLVVDLGAPSGHDRRIDDAPPPFFATIRRAASPPLRRADQCTRANSMRVAKSGGSVSKSPSYGITARILRPLQPTIFK